MGLYVSDNLDRACISPGVCMPYPAPHADDVTPGGRGVYLVRPPQPRPTRMWGPQALCTARGSIFYPSFPWLSSSPVAQACRVLRWSR